jgi:hypothetical protein
MTDHHRCFNEVLAEVAGRQTDRRIAEQGLRCFFVGDGVHAYAAQTIDEAEAMHAAQPRQDRTWF